MISIATYLYSKRVWFVICAVLALASIGTLAQSRKKESGPRALAIAELPKDPKASPRLIPIAIRDKGRFFDASVYEADPRPISVDPGVVYEATRAGDPVGFFTVEGARQVNGEWVALGKWQLRGEEKPARKGSTPQPGSRDGDEGPPVLRRGNSSSSSAPSAPESPSESDSRPKLTRRSENDIPSPDTDPNRPMLRRGKPPEVEHQEADYELPATAKPAAPGQKQPLAPEPFKEVLVAISDAGGPRLESFDFHWTADEQQQWTKKLGTMASQEIIQYAKSKPGLKAPPAANFDHVQVKAFDLARNNNPVLIFTGRVPGAAARGKSPAPENYYYYATVVVMQQSDGELHKLFSSVTDTGHLDAFPRLELIDAVDAEATGYGNLLFRAISDTGRTYRLYRVTRDTLWKLFEGGSGAV